MPSAPEYCGTVNRAVNETRLFADVLVDVDLAAPRPAWLFNVVP